MWSADYVGKANGHSKDKYNDYVVVKTIYDPSPAGFKMPASNAFTGFTETGENSYAGDMNNVPNVDDFSGIQYINNFGLKFWTNSSKTTTIYFPITCYRYNMDGELLDTRQGHYWTAVPACYLHFAGASEVEPVGGPYGTLTYGRAARPVTE